MTPIRKTIFAGEEEIAIIRQLAEWLEAGATITIDDPGKPCFVRYSPGELDKTASWVFNVKVKLPFKEGK